MPGGQGPVNFDLGEEGGRRHWRQVDQFFKKALHTCTSKHSQGVNSESWQGMGDSLVASRALDDPNVCKPKHWLCNHIFNQALHTCAISNSHSVNSES